MTTPDLRPENKADSLPQPDRLRWLHALLILIAVLAAANWRLLSGRAFEKWDAYDYGTPFYSLLSDFARAGKFLYWNPWLAGGSPDFAIAGFGVFSPDLLLFAAATGPGGEALQLYWMAVWIAGGIGMLLLARHLGVPTWGGLVVALGFVFSGFYTGHAEHTGLLYSYSLFPFIIWRLDAAILQGRKLAAAQAGVIWGLSGLAGYVAFTVATVALMLAWVLGRCFFAQGNDRAHNWKQAIAMLVLAGAIGTAVLSPSFFSAVYEGQGYSDRSGALPRAFALESNALHPGALATLSSPSMVELKRGDRTLWSYTDISSVSLYTGSITLFLAMLALTAGPQRSWRWYLFGVALFALVCTMSQALPVRGWIYDLIPPARYFRHAAMLRAYFLFALSILALYGTIEIARWRLQRKAEGKSSLIAALLAIGATIGFVAITLTTDADFPEWPLTAAHFLLVWGGLAALSIVLRRTESTVTRLLPAILIGLAVIDGLVTCHLSRITLYHEGDRPELPLPASSSVALGSAGFGRALGTGAANINLLFKVPTLNNYTPFKNRFHEAIVREPSLRAMALGDKRTWFVPEAAQIPPTEEIFTRFAHRILNLNAPIVVLHSREAMLRPPAPAVPSDDVLGSVPAATNLATTVVDYQPEKLVLETNAPDDGWLMITERWSRSWNAKVNGVPQPVYGANFIFRAVPVVKGDNHIELTFDPVGLPALVVVSWGMVVVVLLGSVFWSWPGRRRSDLRPGAEPDADEVTAAA